MCMCAFVPWFMVMETGDYFVQYAGCVPSPTAEDICNQLPRQRSLTQSRQEIVLNSLSPSDVYMRQ